MKGTAKAVPKTRAVERPAPGFWLRVYSACFGAVLGLAIVKFGNPVILDGVITPPSSLLEAWTDPWPTHWANVLLILLALPGIWLAITHWRGWPGGGAL